MEVSRLGSIGKRYGKGASAEYLRQLKSQYSGPSGQNSVIVGYTAKYALQVHENLEPAEDATRKARGAGKQGKYLEQPARELSNDGTIQKVVRDALKEGLTLEDGLLFAGMRILEASRELVPIQTGNLRASGFVRKESSNEFSSTQVNS